MSEQVHLPNFSHFAKFFFSTRRAGKRTGRSKLPIILAVLGIAWSATVFAAIVIDPMPLKFAGVVAWVAPASFFKVHFWTILVSVGVATVLLLSSLATLRSARWGRWGMIIVAWIICFWSVASLVGSSTKAYWPDNPDEMLILPPLDGIPTLQHPAYMANVADHSWPVVAVIVLLKASPTLYVADSVDLAYALAVLLFLFLPRVAAIFHRPSQPAPPTAPPADAASVP